MTKDYMKNYMKKYYATEKGKQAIKKAQEKYWIRKGAELMSKGEVN